MEIDRSTPALDSLFQELILDHYKRPRNKGELQHADHQVHMNNPTCGDEVRLRVHLRPGESVIDHVSWDGSGCSISQASISVMSELVEGAEVPAAEDLGTTFRELMHARGKGLDEDSEDLLGDATAFTGVAQYPARIKCALLGWAALRDALVQAGAVTTDADQPATTEENA